MFGAFTSEPTHLGLLASDFNPIVVMAAIPVTWLGIVAAFGIGADIRASQRSSKSRRIIGAVMATMFILPAMAVLEIIHSPSSGMESSIYEISFILLCVAWAVALLMRRRKSPPTGRPMQSPGTNEQNGHTPASEPPTRPL